MGWIKESGFDSQQGQEIFLLSIISGLALRPTQPPTQWALGAVYLEVKWQGHEAGDSPPSSAEVKNDGAILPLPHAYSRHSA
jgi:hypothetical protein